MAEVKVKRERREEVVKEYRIGKRDSYVITNRLEFDSQSTRLLICGNRYGSRFVKSEPYFTRWKPGSETAPAGSNSSSLGEYDNFS